MKNFLIALQFLTTIPVKIRSEIKPGDFGKSLLYFPIVGMLIGLALACISSLLAFFPAMVKGVFILVASIFITGGIHLDGFADTCDGFYAGRSKENILQIMRDSRIGVMGAVGIVCLLLLKFTLLVNIPQNILWKSLIMATAFARWSQVLACVSSKYAREDGKAKLFIEYARAKEAIIGGLLVLILFFILAGTKGLALFILNLVCIFLFITYIKSRITGMTGDTIGAASEIAEIPVFLFSLIIAKINI